LAPAPTIGTMCGRYTLTAGGDRVQVAFAEFDLRLQDGRGLGHYNVAPTEQVVAIAAPKGEPEAELMRWGLVPPWSKDLKSSAKMINARLETVTEKPAFRALVPKASRRALLLADGWYEWLKPEKNSEPRQPFHFQVDGGVVFAFAALWAPAKIDDEWIHSVTLLTCDSSPNGVAAGIHDRMPVVLADSETHRAWLSPDLGVEVLDLCGPLPSDRLSARPANPAVNKAGEFDGPELLEP
jgi:putative SOS response-associated peptidase YedK